MTILVLSGTYEQTGMKMAKAPKKAVAMVVVAVEEAGVQAAVPIICKFPAL